MQNTFWFTNQARESRTDVKQTTICQILNAINNIIQFLKKIKLHENVEGFGRKTDLELNELAQCFFKAGLRPF